MINRRKIGGAAIVSEKKRIGKRPGGRPPGSSGHTGVVVPIFPNAKCKDLEDPDLMFPTGPTDIRCELSVAVCQGCPHMQDCLAFAIRSRSLSGTWGGMTEWQRRNKRRLSERLRQLRG